MCVGEGMMHVCVCGGGDDACGGGDDAFGGQG